MQQIENHNCAGLCCEKFCNEKEFCFIELDINEMLIQAQFCKKHAAEFDDRVAGIITRRFQENASAA